jgi:hypothetical protein
MMPTTKQQTLLRIETQLSDASNRLVKFLKSLKKCLTKSTKHVIINSQGKGNGSHLTQKGLVQIMEKMTNVKAIDYVMENFELPADVAEKLTKMRDQFVKKNSGERKPTAKQAEKTAHDAELRSAIVNEMEMDTLYSASDLIKSLPTLSAEPDLSPAKVSYLMRALVDDGSVAKVLDKRHTFYKLAD